MRPVFRGFIQILSERSPLCHSKAISVKALDNPHVEKEIPAGAIPLSQIVNDQEPSRGLILLPEPDQLLDLFRSLSCRAF